VRSDRPEAHRGGHGTPLVLLHGLGMSWRAWSPLLEGLEARHEVLALTLPGHRGGPPAPEVVSVERLADAVESALDAVGFDHPHVVGNSLGGWIALELARRGRARTVTAVSPAGAWRNPVDLVRLQVTLGVSGRFSALPFSGLVLGPYLRSPMGRRLVFRQLMQRGDRMSVADAVDVLADARECTVLPALLKAGRRDGQIAQLSSPDCPIRVVWGRRDKIIPYARYGRPLLHRVSGVEQVSLPAAGHVPMWDAPTLLRCLILELTGSVEALPTEGVVP
jgi:pimeloyl-ACP methyl ester carboxylesterase